MTDTSPLDEFAPNPDARERFQVHVKAPPDVVMRVARGFDMQTHPLVRAIFSLRGRLMGRTPAPRAARGFIEEMRALGWGMLYEEPDRLIVAGAVCQPWLADVRFRAIPASAFRSYDEPGVVKIAWTLETTPADGGTTLATETRVAATDADARRKFLRYWRWARFGIIPIRWLLLPGIARRAEEERQ